MRIRLRDFLPALVLATIVSSASAAPVSPFDPAWVTSAHLTSPHSIYVYTWPQSVKPGDTLSIYVSSISPTVSIRFKRVATGESYIFDATASTTPEFPPACSR